MNGRMDIDTMRTKPLGCAAAVLCFALRTPPAVAQVPGAQVPPLPRLVLDEMPKAARAGLQSAYEDAKASPRDPAAAGRLGMVLHAYEQYRSAETCYRIARALAPQSMSWAYLGGVVSAELGENAGAAASFRRALEIDPDYWPARLRLAAALMEAGELDASRREYETLVRDLPDLALGHYGFARVLSSRGESAAAIAHYERAVALEPPFGPAHYALALAYRDAGLVDRATTHLNAYRRFGARRPVPVEPLLDQIRSMKGLGRDLLAEGARLGGAGRLEESIAMHLKAIEADPTDAQAHVNLVALYGRTGQPGKAETHYRAALALGTSLAEAHYNHGVMLAAGRREDEAAGAFRKALDVDPFYPAAHNNLGALLARKGRLEEAAGHYRRALAGDPRHRAARAGLGRVLIAIGRPLEAVEEFRKLLAPDGRDAAQPLFDIARAYRAAGDRAQAVGYGRQALEHARAGGQADLARAIESWLHLEDAK